MFGGRPPTGSLANRPSSRAQQQRPTQTGRPSTGLQVTDRPTTQHGLGGIRAPTLGRGRNVQDSSYYQTEIRQKIHNVNQEMHLLQNEADQIQRENQNLSSFEKKADTLSEELRVLQGQLGDLNTLVDKLNVEADLDDIERSCLQLHEKNKWEAKILDDVFSARQQKDQQLADVEKLIENETKSSELLLSSLPSESKRQYNTWKEENANYLAEINTKQKELDEYNKKCEELNREVKNDPTKQKSFNLHEKLFELNSKKREIETELISLDQVLGQQEKTQLLAQVKDDTQETQTMDRKIVDLEEQSRKLKEQIAQLDIELDSGTSQNEKNGKYEELLRRDNEMQLFIDSFDSKMQENLDRNSKIEQSIVTYMEKIAAFSKANAAKLPSREVYQELKGDLAFKEKEMKNSATTAESMIMERDRRLQDLEKVNQLESKLDEELKQLKHKLTTLNKQLGSIGNIDDLRKEAEELKEKNLRDREVYRASRDSIRALVGSTVAKHDGKSNLLMENETHNQLTSLEHKFRHHENHNYHLREFIATKIAETDYKSSSNASLKLADEVNLQLIKLYSIL